MKFLPTSPLEVCLLLLGVCMGFLFALDGWTGTDSQKPPKSLKDSPRVRNFKYAALVAGIAFIADLKVIGITSEKDFLLQLYLEGFAIVASVTICVMAVAIHFLFRGRCAQKPGLTFEGSHPALHYLFYGFHEYSRRLAEAERSWKEAQGVHMADYQKFILAFLPNYNSQVTRSIAAINGALNRQQTEFSLQTARGLLNSVEAVVSAYNKDHDGLKIKVNYMRALRVEESNDTQKESARFRYSDWNDFEYLLVLEQYADDTPFSPFALPVRKRNADVDGHLLPGAPAAFAKIVTQVIDDTQKFEFPPGLPEGTVQEIRDYFNQMPFKSFMSMAIIHSGKPCGVLNVEASHPLAFGKNEQERRMIVSLLEPLCHLLGFVVRT